MIATTWKKIFRDLKENKLRVVLAILAISLGITVVIFITVAFAILRREIDINYMMTNPASATFTINRRDLQLMSGLKDHSLVEEVELRTELKGRAKTASGEWIPLRLFALDDYNNIRLDIIGPQEAQWPPADREILIEGQALPVAGKEIGQLIAIKLPGGIEREVPIVGSSLAPGLEQAWMEGTVYGFVTRDTLSWLRINPETIQVKILVAKNKMDLAYIKEASQELKAWMETKGVTVLNLQVPPPGVHPHTRPMSALLMIMQILAILVLFLSCILVVNLISAQLARQVRQIGIMKVIGGRSRQISLIYIGTVLLLGVISLIISFPLGLMAGNAYANSAAKLLNFRITSYVLPFWVYLMQIGLGILLPLLCAAIPILRGSLITPYQAINDHGIDTKKIGSSLVDKITEKLSFLSRPIMLSIRNTFRQRARFFLTLGTIALGGGIFIVSLNFRSSLTYTIDKLIQSRNMDIFITLKDYYSKAEVENSLQGIEGIKQVVGAQSVRGTITHEDGTDGEAFEVLATPFHPRIFNAELLDGRWLEQNETNTVVINHELLEHEPNLKVGTQILINIRGNKRLMTLVGIVREISTPATAYTNYTTLIPITQKEGLANKFLIANIDRSTAGQTIIAAAVEEGLKEAGIEITLLFKMSYWRQLIEDHLVMISDLLLLMALLLIIVGGLGLASTMSINVLQRTREIGVMRSIGATTPGIIRIVVVEGMMMGLLSWITAVIISLPLTRIMGNLFGDIFFETYVDITYSIPGFFFWLFFALILSAAASYYPAWKASQMTVRETLAYE